MLKLCLNTRDELLIIDLEQVAYFLANGNYTQIQYITGGNHLLTLGLSKAEELIRKTWPADKPSPFIRLGRSLIVNQTYLSAIQVLKQKLILSDGSANSYSVTVPKPLLKEYKEKISEFYLRKNN